MDEELAPLPDDLLDRIREFTDGGFVLIYLNGDRMPFAHIQPDSFADELALIKFGSDCFAHLDESANQFTITEQDDEVDEEEEA